MGDKVQYWTDGVRRTAYLDSDLDDLGEDPSARRTYVGTEKHTDAPVTLRWTGERFEEVHD